MFRSTRSSLAIAALIAAGLALSGCGRKSGLDLPPTASAQPEEPAGPAVAETAEDQGRAIFGSPATSADLPPARAGKKAFVLDPLLD